MPTLDLSDEEMRDAALAARAATLRAALDARGQANPRIVAALKAGAERYARLSEKFENAQSTAVRLDLPVLATAPPIAISVDDSFLCAEPPRHSVGFRLRFHKLALRCRSVFRPAPPRHACFRGN
jgi:hypothetical protein